MQEAVSNPTYRDMILGGKEFSFGDLHLWASPASLISLTLRRKADEKIDQLLRDFENPEKREAMSAEMWVTFLFQLEYKFNNTGSLYFIVYGPRGLGKSEVAMAIMELCIETLHSCTGKWALPGFCRNPSGINNLLAQATIGGFPACIQADETGREVAQGSATDEKALRDNVESVRILLPTIIRCANRLQRLAEFSQYCDFVFELIYSDRDERVNYCIMYAISEEVEDKYGRIPIGIINFPMHTNEDLRAQYEASKMKEQIAFTSSGGKQSSIRAELQPMVQALVNYCKENHLTVGRGRDYDITGPKDFLDTLIWDVDGGDTWTGGQQELICRRAFKLLRSKKQDTPGSVPPAPVETPVTIPEFKGPTEDLRAAIFARLLERGNDSLKVKALEIWVTKHISQDEVALMISREHFHPITQPSVNGWIKDVGGTEDYFERTELGFAFEDVYSVMLTAKGVPHIKGGGNTPEPDIVVFVDDGQHMTPKEVISLKCYVQRRKSYVIMEDRIGKREKEYAAEKGIPLYLVLFDIWHNKLYEPRLVDGRATYNYAV